MSKATIAVINIVLVRLVLKVENCAQGVYIQD